jgi:hypothetical protein
VIIMPARVLYLSIYLSMSAMITSKCSYVTSIPNAHYYVAKARQLERQREQEAAASSAPNTNNKRPLSVIPATSTSPTTSRIAKGDNGTGDESSAASDKNKRGKLARDKRLGTYFEYDLSKMVNSKGGFLVEEGADEDLERLRRKERERERQRAEKNTDIRTCFSFPRVLAQFLDECFPCAFLFL